MMFTRPHFLLFVYALLLVVGLDGCSKGNEQKAASQVAAKVNSEEITVYQINSVLTRIDNPDPEALPNAKRTILDKLVEQELAVQAALENKLDRTPTAVQAMESAKREILTRAYFAQITSNLPKPTATEINKYYDEHPELFADRRLYNLQQIVATGDQSVLKKVQDLVGEGRSIQDLANWLKEHDVKFAAEGGVRAAEQIPLDIIPKLKAAKDGQTIVVEGPKSSLILHLVSTQSQPMGESDAAPRIQQFLANQRANEAIVNELKRLKQQARIEYVGEFSSIPPGGGAVPEQPKTQGADASPQLNMGKAIAGLK